MDAWYYVQKYGITVITLIAMFGWYLKVHPEFKAKIQKNPFDEYDEPGTASTLGVLGTFLGITLGLFSFDATPAHMQESVVSLLGGMTTAFLTSLCGMGMSLYMKHEQKIVQEAASVQQEHIKTNATIADLITFMSQHYVEQKEMNQSLLSAMQENNNALQGTISFSVQEIRNSIVGDGDYSIISQIKTLRLETRDELTKIREEITESNNLLIKEFRDFAKTMAENNAKSFIEALNETMKDFNTKLTEQFGENFKQLNVAVGRLLEWQEHYKETIETVTENQKVIFSSMAEVKNSLKDIEASANSMTISAGKMSDLIVTANVYNERLNNLLEEMNKIGQDAEKIVPHIDEMTQMACNNMENLTSNATDKLENYVNSATQLITGVSTKAIKETQDSVDYIMTEYETEYKNLTAKIQELIASLQKVSDDIKASNDKALANLGKQTDKTIAALTDISMSMTDSSRKLRQNLEVEMNATKESVKKAAESLAKSSLSVTEDISNHLDEMMRTNNENLKKSSENLSRNLDDKITESLESLGVALAQISQKFAQDYTPLADKLREVVQLANQIQESQHKR